MIMLINGSNDNLPPEHKWLCSQAYVTLVYLAVTTKRPKYIVFSSVLASVFLLIAYNIRVSYLSSSRFEFDCGSLTFCITGQQLL